MASTKFKPESERDFEPLDKLNHDLLTAARTLTRQEARYFVDRYYQIQEERKRVENQLRAASETGEPNSLLLWDAEQTFKREKAILKALTVFGEEFREGRWLISQHGIGPVMTAGLLAHIDITKAPTPSSIWSFAGKNPQAKWLGREKATKLFHEVRETFPKRGFKLEGMLPALEAASHMKAESIERWARAYHKDGQLTAENLVKALSRCPWNMALKVLCIHPEQRITTRHGYVPINQINVGDEVLTHKGRWRKVTEVLSREYSGDMIGLRAHRAANQIAWMTPEHPIYARQRHAWHYHRTGRGLCFKVPPEKKWDADFSWHDVVNIRAGDLAWVPLMPEGKSIPTLTIDSADTIDYGADHIIATGRWEHAAAPRAIAVPRSVVVTTQLAYVIGLYIAEGHVSGNHIGFSFHAKEESYREAVQKGMEESFGIKNPYYSTNIPHNSVQMIYTSKPLARTFAKWFGHDSYAVHIPHAWMESDASIRIALLRGIFDGDGYYKTKQYRLTTVSEMLARQVCDVLRGLGISAAIHTKTDGKAFYVLVHDEALFNRIIREGVMPEERKEDGYAIGLVFPQVGHYEGLVYNLEVEEDHSYVVEGLAVHNCYKIAEYGFVRPSTSPKASLYSLTYRARKVEEVERNNTGYYAEAAKRALQERTIRDNDLRATYESGRLPDGQLDRRARIYAIKLFLSHVHHVFYECHYGKPPPLPYIFEHDPRHTKYVPVPGWPVEG